MSKKEWLKLIENSYSGKFLVNCKYRPQLKDIAVLRKLIREKKLKVERYGSRTSRKTYLTIAG